MTTYRTARFWLWLERASVVIGLAGGTVLLILAAAAHDLGSIPLGIFGGGWFLLGILSLGRRRTTVDEVRLECDTVTFVDGRDDVTVPTMEIDEIRRARFDSSFMAPMEVSTQTQGIFRINSHLADIPELLSRLRDLNPDIDVAHL